MAYIYHLDDGTILGVSPTQTLSFPMPHIITWYDSPSMDADYNYLKFKNNRFYENVAAYKELFKQKVVEDMGDELGQGFLTSLGLRFNCFMEDVLKIDGGYRLALMAQSQNPSITHTEVRDYNDNAHYLPLDQISIIVMELGANQQRVLSKKWKIQRDIDACTTVDEIKTKLWASYP